MKSSTRNLIVAAVCAAVLGGAAFALSRSPGGGESSSAASSSPGLELVSKKDQDVASMKVTNKKGSYTLVPAPKSAASSSPAASSSASSAASSVTYTVSGLEGCPINTSATESVVKNGFSLVATKNLGAVSSLQEYGLADPQASVEVRFKDGSSFSYKIGGQTATDASAYYMCGENSNNVYVVSVDQGLLEDKTYFVSKEILAVPESSSSSSASDAAAGGYDFTQISLSGANFPKPVRFEKTGSGLAITQPAAYEADADKLNALETALESLTADTVEAVRPDAAALKKYGLDRPSAVAEFTVNRKSYRLLLGAKTGSSYPAMLDGVDVVYTVTQDKVAPWAEQNLLDLRSKLIYLPDIETVQSVKITRGTETHEILVSRREKPASSSSASSGSRKTYTYTVTGDGGKTLKYDGNYQNFYQKLIGLTIFAEPQKAPSGQPAATVEYRYFDKAGADTVAFYADGERRLTAVKNGAVCGDIAKSSLDDVFDVLARFEKGETIPAAG
ncbi:MAG TPA: hypothetical protein DEB16_04925 [Ruminococcaceae bacterium]|nr:hypothetical protein [Oscillospiraceae bacterium]